MNEAEKDLRPGWVRADDEGRELNAHQKLAKKTHGLVRVPNLMTAMGVGANILSAVKASDGKPVVAVASAAVGFALDMEGTVARKLGVEDPVWGARSDQAADAAKAGITAGVLLSNGIFPKTAAALTYGPKLAGAGVGLWAKLNGNELASSHVGKAAEWPRDIAPLGFLLASAGRKFNAPRVETAGNIIGWTSAGVAAMLGSVAAAGYYLEASDASLRNP